MLITPIKRFGLAGLAALALSGVTAASPAGAEVTGDVPSAESRGDDVAGTEVASSKAAVPSCVVRWYHNHTRSKHVHLYNSCRTTRYVKVIVAYGPDSECKALVRGQSGTHSWSYGWPYDLSRFDRLVRC